MLTVTGRGGHLQCNNSLLESLVTQPVIMEWTCIQFDVFGNVPSSTCTSWFKTSQAFGFAQRVHSSAFLCVSLMDHLCIHVSRYFVKANNKNLQQKKLPRQVHWPTKIEQLKRHPWILKKSHAESAWANRNLTETDSFRKCVGTGHGNETTQIWSLQHFYI